MDNKTTCMQGQKKIIWVTNGNENTGSSSHSDLTTQNLKTCFDNLGQKYQQIVHTHISVATSFPLFLPNGFLNAI